MFDKQVDDKAYGIFDIISSEKKEFVKGVLAGIADGIKEKLMARSPLAAIVVPEISKKLKEIKELDTVRKNEVTEYLNTTPEHVKDFGESIKKESKDPAKVTDDKIAKDISNILQKLHKIAESSSKEMLESHTLYKKYGTHYEEFAKDLTIKRQKAKQEQVTPEPKHRSYKKEKSDTPKRQTPSKSKRTKSNTEFTDDSSTELLAGIESNTAKLVDNGVGSSGAFGNNTVRSAIDSIGSNFITKVFDEKTLDRFANKAKSIFGVSDYAVNKVPVVNKVPEVPVVNKVPEVPEVPVVNPVEPVVNKVPEVPVVNKVPEVPVVNKVPEVPEVPVVNPVEPVVNKVPEVPVVNKVPEVPVVNKVPEDVELVKKSREFYNPIRDINKPNNYKQESNVSEPKSIKGAFNAIGSNFITKVFDEKVTDTLANKTKEAFGIDSKTDKKSIDSISSISNNNTVNSTETVKETLSDDIIDELRESNTKLDKLIKNTSVSIEDKQEAKKRPEVSIPENNKETSYSQNNTQSNAKSNPLIDRLKQKGLDVLRDRGGKLLNKLPGGAGKILQSGKGLLSKGVGKIGALARPALSVAGRLAPMLLRFIPGVGLVAGAAMAAGALGSNNSGSNGNAQSNINSSESGDVGAKSTEDSGGLLSTLGSLGMGAATMGLGGLGSGLGALGSAAASGVGALGSAASTGASTLGSAASSVGAAGSRALGSLGSTVSSALGSGASAIGSVGSKLAAAAGPVAALTSAGLGGYELGTHVINPLIDKGLSAASGKDTSLGSWIYDKLNPEPEKINNTTELIKTETKSNTIESVGAKKDAAVSLEIIKSVPNTSSNSYVAPSKPDQGSKIQNMVAQKDAAESQKAAAASSGSGAPIIVNNTSNSSSGGKRGEEQVQVTAIRNHESTFERVQMQDYWPRAV
jgi:hypothetical protein